MSRKKKHPVKKLSDEDYGKYIMALKDETPPLAVRKLQEENWFFKKISFIWDFF